MSEWWTYSLRDLLLFSPQTYYRLFELVNVEWWPLQIVALALGLTMLGLWHRGGSRAGRSIAVMLALAWLWVGWAFHGQRYASINPAADFFAWAFAIEAGLLLWLGGLRGRLLPAPLGGFRQRAGLAVFLFAWLAFPALAPALGRGWKQAEVFGMAPDPTALATLGVLLLVPARVPWGLVPIPFVWCLVSGATLWAMVAPDYAIVPLLALMAVMVALVGVRAGRAR